jgi:hypothetical protein
MGCSQSKGAAGQEKNQAAVLLSCRKQQEAIQSVISLMSLKMSDIRPLLLPVPQSHPQLHEILIHEDLKNETIDLPHQELVPTRLVGESIRIV